MGIKKPSLNGNNININLVQFPAGNYIFEIICDWKGISEDPIISTENKELILKKVDELIEEFINYTDYEVKEPFGIHSGSVLSGHEGGG
jgi:hypothetical protein